MGVMAGSATFGSFALNATGSTDAYVAQLNHSDGSVVWAYRAGGTGLDSGTALAYGGGKAYLTGNFGGTGTCLCSPAPCAVNAALLWQVRLPTST